MTSSDICSTPSSKLISQSSCPSTPNKKGKYVPLQKLITTPSKYSQAPLPFQLLSPTYDSKEEARLEQEYMRMRMTKIRFNGSISPLSETCPSITSEKTCSETIEINKLLNKQLYEELTHGQERHEPRHKVSKPTRPILKINVDSLNYLVSSSRGSVADATIYATEINATRQPMPMVTSPWEKLTIPVNPSIKSKYIRLKQELFAEDEINSDEEECDTSSSTTVDAAIVRGFAFAKQETSTRSPFYTPKKLRWAN